MLLLSSVAASVATCFMCVFAYKTLIGGGIKVRKNFLANTSIRSIIITRIVSKEKGCTLGEIARDSDGKGFFSDTKKNKLVVNKSVFPSDKYPLPEYLFLNGTKVNARSYIKSDFLRTLSFYSFYIVVEPIELA